MTRDMGHTGAADGTGHPAGVVSTVWTAGMLTRQEAEAIYEAGKETVVEVLLKLDACIHYLGQQVRDLTTRLSDQRVRHLEQQLAKHSRNSSKPPSSDGLKKPAPKSQRSMEDQPPDRVETRQVSAFRADLPGG